MRILFGTIASRARNHLQFLTRASLLAGCACGAFHAQQDLEGSLPTDWNVSTGTLSISPHHYKMGSESLRWDWVGGDTITVSPPGINTADVIDTKKGTCDFWVWNGTPGGKIKVEFMNGTTAQYWFEFNLNYIGWRRAVRSYLYDMEKLVANRTNTFDSVRITAPDLGAGSLYFDAVTWVGNRYERIRDAQNPGISGNLSNSSWADAYAQVPPIFLTAPTAGELAELRVLRARWLDAAKGNFAPSSDIVAAAKTKFEEMDIAVGTNGIRGVVVGKNTSALDDDISVAYKDSWPRTLAKDYAWNIATANSSRDQMLQLANHLMDQGHAANSNELPTATNTSGYDYRRLPTALILMAPAYDTDMKQKTWDWLRWAYHLGDFWTTTWERDTDDIHLYSFQQLGAILFLVDHDEAVRQLRAKKLYLVRFWEFSEGSEDGVKVDGTGFHHRSHYNNYMYVYGTMISTAYILRDTGFQINLTTYENLRFAVLTYMRMSADASGATIGYFGNALCGRKPFDTNISFSKTALRQLGELGGQFYPTDVDEVVAQAFNRRFGTGDALAFVDVDPEPSPDGFYQFNHSPLGIYRRANWVASIRAPQRYFWSSEIYSNENRYGRYQSYGVLEILYFGGLSKSGQQLNGWDWNHPPRHHPHRAAGFQAGRGKQPGRRAFADQLLRSSLLPRWPERSVCRQLSGDECPS